MNLLSSALPWRGLLFFPALLVFIGVLLFSTATLAFYVKQTVSFTRLRKVLARYAGLLGNGIAALLGAATPFCTCTAVPLFLGMLEVEIPLGPAISFLLASPTINLGAVILFDDCTRAAHLTRENDQLKRSNGNGNGNGNGKPLRARGRRERAHP